MSRLDEDLKLAFRRQPPPPDFTDRVMARLEARREEPRRVLWHSWFQFTALRWAAAAAMVLVLAGSLWQWRRAEPPAVSPPAASETLARESVAAGPPEAAAPARPENAEKPEPVRPNAARGLGRRAPRRADARLAEARRRERLRKEGEEAVEKLKLALAIASATLNEAQRRVQNDD